MRQPRHWPKCEQPALDEGEDRCPQCGQLQPGNLAGGLPKGGLRSPRAQDALLPGQEAMRAVLEDHRRQWLNDLGGDEQLSFAARDLVNRGLRLHVLLDTLEARMEREGVLSAKGRTRASATLYLTILDRVMRIYQQLGLERKVRPVNPLDAVRVAVARANGPVENQP